MARMKQWQYTIVNEVINQHKHLTERKDYEELDEILNELGEEGWEYAGLLYVGFDDYRNLFKREYVDDDDDKS